MRVVSWIIVVLCIAWLAMTNVGEDVPDDVLNGWHFELDRSLLAATVAPPETARGRTVGGSHHDHGVVAKGRDSDRAARRLAFHGAVRIDAQASVFGIMAPRSRPLENPYFWYRRNGVYRCNIASPR